MPHCPSSCCFLAAASAAAATSGPLKCCACKAPPKPAPVAPLAPIVKPSPSPVAAVQPLPRPQNATVGRRMLGSRRLLQPVVGRDCLTQGLTVAMDIDSCFAECKKRATDPVTGASCLPASRHRSCCKVHAACPGRPASCRPALTVACHVHSFLPCRPAPPGGDHFARGRRRPQRPKLLPVQLPHRGS